MMLEIVIIFLLLFILIKEHIMWRELQKLTDKIISRDFTEYTNGIKEIIEAKREKKDDGFQKLFKV